MLNADDMDKIAAAVAFAEDKTSGEILSVVTAEVSEYRETPMAWAAAAALVLPPLALVAGVKLDRLSQAFSSWTAADALGPFLSAYALFQAAVFIVFLAIASVPAVRRALTPRRLKQRRVRKAALQHFAGARPHLEAGRTAVLVFASLGDRQIEIVADDAIHAAVDQSVWDHAVAEALKEIGRDGPAAGVARAVELCGAALATHFPADGVVHAPDRPVQI